MPRTRTMTDVGYLEVQWTKSGKLACVVSATVVINPDGSRTITQTTHQFTEPGDLGVFIRDLARSRKKSWPEPNENTVGPRSDRFADNSEQQEKRRLEMQMCYNVLTDHYSKEIAAIIKNNTAGDNTWVGLLSAFLVDILRTNDPRNEGDPPKLITLLENGFTLETFMMLEPRNRNVLLGIPQDEAVSYQSYIDMFNEFMEVKKRRKNTSERV